MDDEEEIESNKANYFDLQEQLILRGDGLQKLSVISSLPELLNIDKNGALSKIIPKVQQELLNASTEFNLAASKMFIILINMEISANLIPQILQGIENKDPIIANAWMETLLSVIPSLKENVIKHEILKCAVSKSQLSKAAYFRVSSCRILGKLSVHPAMNSFDVKKDILPLVQSLCQDCFHEVRAAMCNEIPNVAKGLHNLGDAVVKINLLPLLVELSSDENIYVRSIAIDSVIMTIPYLGSDTTKGTIIPLIKKLCNRSVSEGDTTYTAIANNFRKLIVHTRPYLTTNDALWFLDYFIHISKKGLTLVVELDSDPSVSMLCRESCARSIPTVTSMVLAEIPNEINIKWYHTFKDLAGDPCYIVRKAVAATLDETIRVLGSDSKLIVSEFAKLLRDDDEEVLQEMVPKISTNLEVFSTTGVLSRDLALQATLDIGRALLKCATQVFKTFNWRMKESILVQFEVLPMVMPSDFIHQHFTQFIINASLNGKAKPVRSQATRTLLIFLRYNAKDNHRKWILESISNRLCNANCCYTRQIFINLCIHAISIFSKKFFKEHFYLPLLSLTDDPVSVVRLSVIKLCPILKQMLSLPDDRALQLKLENILSKMEMIESDIDVIRALRCKLKDMRSLPLNKTDALIEEKRRLDEEEKISKGKIPTKLPTPLKPTKPDPILTNIDMSKPTAAKSLKKTVPSTISDMPFLGQHFYIDAGVSFSNYLNSSAEDAKVNRNLYLTKDSTYRTKSYTDKRCVSINVSEMDNINDKSDFITSVGNVNVDTLTDVDLKKLEITTNITDDVKASIQKISKESQLNKRSKRYSYTFLNDTKEDTEKKRREKLLKRRSLNISIAGDSKIPVSSKTGNKLLYSEKCKSSSDQNLSLSSIISPKNNVCKVPRNEMKLANTEVRRNFVKTPVSNPGDTLSHGNQKKFSMFKEESSIDAVYDVETIKFRPGGEKNDGKSTFQVVKSSKNRERRKSSSNLPVLITRRPVK
ncbi:serine/threonine-protein phosphatase 4 regulatory subunit 4-like isoform X2 [Sitophilus oryzae]|uniref:Serine/threonine-protein phosphatase 4 regulatory subunit 4-like isoform X2 n=1 Tax=Sitophilus oryzae TaxID=7048 RepID=A0A6J2X5S8_SITOR|nr:serine/threonine-protein phosphatase 4 regulatory subunit 4-like isoform X2 [Sitophilus oryzae]